jgi:hypothetical protein
LFPCGYGPGFPHAPFKGGKGKNTIKGINEGFSLSEVCKSRLYVCFGFSSKNKLTAQKFGHYQKWQKSGGAHAPPRSKKPSSVLTINDKTSAVKMGILVIIRVMLYLLALYIYYYIYFIYDIYILNI